MISYWLVIAAIPGLIYLAWPQKKFSYSYKIALVLWISISCCCLSFIPESGERSSGDIIQEMHDKHGVYGDLLGVGLLLLTSLLGTFTGITGLLILIYLVAGLRHLAEMIWGKSNKTSQIQNNNDDFD